MSVRNVDGRFRMTAKSLAIYIVRYVHGVYLPGGNLFKYLVGGGDDDKVLWIEIHWKGNLGEIC